MIEPYPSIDSRRTKKLVAELKRLAEVFVPNLRDARTEDSVSDAVFEIAARLVGQVTQRLDKVPRRDVIAFFHTLDIPQQAPRTARAPLIFTLSEKVEKSVAVAARIQVGAKGKADEQVIFETRFPINLTPARLSYLAAVDALRNYIEEPPPQFFKLARQDTQTAYELVTTAAKDSKSLQITPALGLEKGDVIGIDKSVYRLEEFKNGLAALVNDDLLEQNFEAGTDVRKVFRFDTFQLRNLQQHVIYIGHAELLNLEQKSTIHLAVDPSSVATLLMNLEGISFELSRIDAKDKTTKWQPVNRVSASDGELHLQKDWDGPVDEVEVHGQKSRWLRIKLKQSNDNPQSKDLRISSFKLRVESGKVAAQQTATSGDGHCFDENQSSVEKETDDVCFSCEIEDKGEGSKTIKQAFHNATPLPLTTRFSPFGSEPLRFDTFALSAPEALSKKGSKVALAVELVDATPAVLELALNNSNTNQVHVYAIGVNGRLQILELENGKLNKWQELGHPKQLPVMQAGNQDIKKLRLDPTVSPQAITIENVDLVVAGDQAGRLWATKVSKKTDNSGFFENTNWEIISSPPSSNNAKITDLVLLSIFQSANSASSSPYVNGNALLFATTDLGIFYLAVSASGVLSSTWREISSNNPVKPHFDSGDQAEIKTRLILVFTQAWPSPPDVFQSGLVMLDAQGIFWRGRLQSDLSKMDWEEIAASGSGAVLVGSSDVRPVATAFVNGGVETAFTLFSASKDDRQLFALKKKMGASNYELLEPEEKFIVEAETKLLCDPSFYLNEEEIQPLVLAFGQKEDKPSVMAFWMKDDLREFNYPPNRAFSGKPNGILLPRPELGSPPFIIINGGRETIYQIMPIVPFIDSAESFTLSDWVMSPNGLVSDYIELINPNSNQRKIEDISNKLAIYKNGNRFYGLGEKFLGDASIYNLYKKLSDTFSGVISGEGGGGQGAAVRAVRTDSNTPNKLKLAALDKSTAKGSKLIIKSNIYNVSEVDNFNSTRIATLNKPLPGKVNDSVNYELIKLITSEQGEKVLDEQLGTLFQLKSEKASLVFPVTRIHFKPKSGEPITQSIELSDKQGEIISALPRFPLTEYIPQESSATVFFQSGVSDWSAESFQPIEKNPELSWEYYNGDGWRSLDKDFNDTTNHLAVSGKICFRVPDDITPTEIAGQEDFWLRARLIGGDYGRTKYIATTTPDSIKPEITTQTITIDTSELRAPEILAIEACFQMDDKLGPEIVLTENNRDVLDQTQANKIESASFALFEGTAAIDPDFQGSRALYFGFTKPYNVNPLSLYVDADEPEAIEILPESIKLDFEVLAQGRKWRKVVADDLTHGFQRRGYVKLFIDVVPQRSRLFGKELFWLRVSPVADDRQWSPLLKGIYINAADAEQASSVKQEILGASTGEPKQYFVLSKPPVISNSLVLRVRETLSDDERQELEQVAKGRMNRSTPQSEADLPIIETYPEIPGQWVLWKQIDSFVAYDGDARVYQLDPASGKVRFGDGKQGKIPPVGSDSIRAISYQSGGGEVGNVDAFAIEELKSSVESVDRVTNPIEATGGVDAPDVDLQLLTAPDRLRHRQQALTPLDMEALALSWSSEIVRARCIPPHEPDEPIKVYIARRTGERCPKASLAERDALSRYLVSQGWGALHEDDIRVYNPDYVNVYVSVEIIAESSDMGAMVEKEAKDRLLKLLHPIEGGPDGKGWLFGRGLWKSDLFRALAGTPGLDRVKSIELQPGSWDILPPSSLICANGEENVTVKVGIDKRKN